MVFCADIHFWRQSLVLLAISIQSIASGFILAFPAVLNPAILSQNATDIRVTQDQASWITSAYGFAGILGFCIMPGIMQKYGRKVTHILINVSSGIGFIMIALTQNVTTLYIARSIQGLSLNGVYLATLMIAEYAHPKRRGYFITLKTGSVAFGSLSCHSLVLICPWRQIAGIAVILNIMGLILTFFWAESPAYFGMKGLYEECDKSYKHLHGDTAKSKKELEDLISAQEERHQKNEQEQRKEQTNISNIVRKLLREDFVKPFFIIVLLTVIIDSGGRYYNLAYIVQIVQDITGDNSLAIYCSIGLDVLTIIACLTSSYVITKFPRRTILFTFGCVSVALMLIISFIVFLKRNNFATNIVWLTPCVILFNSFIVNVGVIPVCFAVSGEVFPLEHRGSGFTATGIIFTLLYGITMKCTPIMMEKTGIEGTYGTYALCLAICLLVLFFILTETKDKSLQEIEYEMKNIDRTKKTLNMQEMKFLTGV